MRRIIYLVMAMMTITACNKDNSTDEPNVPKQPENQQKGIKSIREIDYNYHVRYPDQRDFLSHKLTIYHTDGKIKEMHSFLRTGEIGSKTFFTYDSKGNLIETETKQINDNMSQDMTTKNTYDENGNLIQISNGYEDRFFVYSYDSEGNRVVHIKLIASGYSYPKYEYVIKYVKNEIIHYTKEGRMTKRIIKNERDQIIEDIQYNFDGNIVTIINQYDDKGNIIGYTHTRTYNNSVVKGLYTYKFDKEGNWIEQVTYIDGEIKKLKEREIEYFDE